MSTPRGIRNNNPLNIRINSTKQANCLSVPNHGLWLDRFY